MSYEGKNLVSNEEEEVYREVRRDIIRRYYSGYLARDEYTEELEELDRRKYEGISGGGGGGGFNLNFDSYWNKLPPEQFDRNLSIFTLGISIFCFFLGYNLHVYRESPLLIHYGATSTNVAILLTVILGLVSFFTGILGLRIWWRKKSSGKYASGAKNLFIRSEEEV